MTQAKHISNNQQIVSEVYKPTHKIQYSVRAIYILPSQQRFCLQTAPHQQLGSSLQFIIEKIAPQLQGKQLFLLYNGIQVNKHMNYYDLSLDRSFQNYQIKIVDQKPLKKQKARLKYTTSFKKQRQIDKCNIRKLTSQEMSDLIARRKKQQNIINEIVQQRQTKRKEKLHDKNVQANNNAQELKKRYQYLISEQCSSLTQLENFIVKIENQGLKVPNDALTKLKQKRNSMIPQYKKDQQAKIQNSISEQDKPIVNLATEQYSELQCSIIIVTEEGQTIVNQTSKSIPKFGLETVQKLAETYKFQVYLNQYIINQQNYGEELDVSITIQDMTALYDTNNLKFIAKRKK